MQASDHLIAQIQNNAQDNYTLYTFYELGDSTYIHRQKWEGIVGLDDLKISRGMHVAQDDLGNTIVDWHKIPRSKSLNKSVFNPHGDLFRKQTINPDSSFSDAIDLNTDGIADFVEYLNPNGDKLILINEDHGARFLDEMLQGLNPFCQLALEMGWQPEEVPGCSNNSSENDDGWRFGLGSAKPGNPLDQMVDDLCAAYESPRGFGENPGTHTQGSTSRVATRPIHAERVEERGIQTVRTKTTVLEDGTERTTVTVFSRRNNGNQDFSIHETDERPDGTQTQRIRETRTQRDGTVEYRDTTVEYAADGTQTWQTKRTTRHPDGTVNSTVTGMVCTNGSCTDTDPGPDPDFEASMGEFCSILKGDRESRPNDLSELNKKARDERCSIKPNEAANNEDDEGEPLKDTCVFDDNGHVEVGALLTGGACVTAAGGTHFNYSNPQQCASNEFSIFGHGVALIGGAGMTGFVCNPSVCRRPDF